jgi:hypothetical protein
MIQVPGKSFNCVLGWLLSLPEYIIWVWKCFPDTNTLAYFVKSRKTKRFNGINSYKTKLEVSPSNELDSVRIFSLLKRYNLLDNVVTSYVRQSLNLEHIILMDFKINKKLLDKNSTQIFINFYVISLLE